MFCSCLDCGMVLLSVNIECLVEQLNNSDLKRDSFVTHVNYHSYNIQLRFFYRYISTIFIRSRDYINVYKYKIVGNIETKYLTIFVTDGVTMKLVTLGHLV